METLTALTILAIALVSLLQAQSTGLRAAGSAERYSQARLLAQSLLAQGIGVRSEPPRSTQGRSGPFTWSIDVIDVRQPWAQVESEAGWRLYQMRVRVAWDRERRVELHTLKLARAPQPDTFK